MYSISTTCAEGIHTESALYLSITILLNIIENIIKIRKIQVLITGGLKIGVGK